MMLISPNTSTAGENLKTVADPSASYLSMLPLWGRSRAVCSGERAVKEYDAKLDVGHYQNLLIPFSPTMSPDQYAWYRSEAELPGIVAQYARIIVGGLLRKKPSLELPEGVPEEAHDWIMNHFSQDNTSITSFLDKALMEEMQTSRAWVYIDYPNVSEVERDNMEPEELAEIKPYPVLWKAEEVINHRVGISSINGTQELKMVIRRGYEEVYKEGEFHPTYLDTVWVHQVIDNKYSITKYQNKATNVDAKVSNGEIIKNFQDKTSGFEPEDPIFVMCNDKNLTFIPAWPLNGSITPIEPILMTLIDREVALYNKMSRRNHLLYGASTYTPWVSSDMPDENFKAIVGAGLGSWIHIGQEDKIGVLDTPTEALEDMDRAITNAIDEIARIGVRMLAPETGEQSGIALEIRNGAQTAQLGTLNAKSSSQMSDIIAFMINWRYDLDIKSSEVKFMLSDDFNPAPMGDAWLRLITEWYQAGLIPRTIWLTIMKQNDIVPPDYNDEEGQKEINSDPLVVTPKEDMEFNAKLQKEVAAQKGAAVDPNTPGVKGPPAKPTKPAVPGKK